MVVEPAAREHKMTIERVRSALHSIDSSCDRETWVRIGMAARSAGLRFDDWHDWSEGASNYRNEADCRAVWQSFKDSGGIGAGTLFAAAREGGWQDPTRHQNGHDHGPSPGQRQNPPQARRPSSQGMRPPFDFGATWAAADLASTAHAYIVRKLGLPAGLRVYRGSLSFAGQALDGALLVPVHSADGNLQSWQAIPPEGKKINAPGATIRGGSFTVGGPIGDSVYLVEGLGQAWSVHQASRKPAVVCFGAGNIKAIAKQLRERYPALHIAICFDRGKEADGERIAKIVGGVWVEMPSDWPTNADINDLHLRDGLQAVADLLDQARKPASEAAPVYASFHDLDTNPPPEREWVVDQWLPVGSVVALFGGGGVGKTLLVQQIATSVANGLPLFGKKVRMGPTLAILCEDDTDELRRRQRSIFAQLGRSQRYSADGLHFEARAGKLNALATFDAERRIHKTPLFDAIEQECKRVKPVLVIIDNISQVFAGNEVDRHEVTSFCNLLSGLALRHRCTVLLLGHIAKAQGSEFSGSTAWENAVRTRLWLERRDDGLTELHRKKANYSSRDSITLEYRLGAFAEVGDGADTEPLMVKTAEDAVLKALDTFTSRQVATSGNPTARTYLPRMADKEGLLPGLAFRVACKALSALTDRGDVVPNTKLGWRNSTRHVATGLARKQGNAPEIEKDNASEVEV